jgi:hypothetical protein
VLIGKSNATPSRRDNPGGIFKREKMKFIDLRNSQPAHPFKKPIRCSCGCGEWIENAEQFKNQSIHIRGTCKRCGKFIQWIPYTESSIIKNLLLSELERQHDNA